MKRAATVALIATLAVALAHAGPAAAISGGELDGNRHPNVAIIYFYQPDGRFRCSATLVSSTVLVTAAHCTDGVRGKVLASFESVAPAAPKAADDPGDLTSQTGFTGPQTGWISGTPHTHPLWDDELQLNDLHDVGVVVLDKPYTKTTPAKLTPRSYLDGVAARKGGLNKQTFTLAGYGVYFEKPADGPQKPDSVSDRTRRFTTASGQNLTSQVLKLQENANNSQAEGGSCFGDSGGPVFVDGYLVADTSFGASQFCRSSGGYFRLDIDDARSFLDDYLTLP